MKKHELNIFPEIGKEDYSRLKDDLSQNGYDKTQPIVLYNGKVLDGWSRQTACKELKITPQYRDFTGTKTEAFEFVLRTNKRRSLTPSQWAAISVEADELIEAIRQETEAERRKKQGKTQTQKVGNEEHLSVNKLTVAKKEDNTKRATHKLAAAFNTNRTYVTQAAKLRKEQPEIFAQVRSGEKTLTEVFKKNVHVSFNSGENEWYTPKNIIVSAKKVMGGIDLDPASSNQANKTVGAASFFTAEDDGLSKKWSGRVWMNPPYSQPLIKHFSAAITKKYLSGEIDEAMVLVNNATDTEWFQCMIASCVAVCFLRGRVRFIDPKGNPSGTPLQGQAIIYFGPHFKEFGKEFHTIGTVLWKEEK